MKVVYTYCQIDKSKPVSDFTMKLASLAICSMKRNTRYKTVLYTDCAEFFKNLPFDDIIDVDFFTWNWDKRYWNIPKLHTYSIQEEPFIHVDLDISVTKSFRINTTKDFITERIRTIADDQYPYKHLSKELSDGTVLCSGIFGCSNTKPLDLFKELYEKAKVECAEGVNDTVIFDDLYSIEEHWMKKRVNDLGYSVYEFKPYMFYHFGGGNKKEKYGKMVDSLCKNMGLTDF